jgi:DNA repair protein RadC
MIIRELPEAERPREKLLRFGQEQLTNTELIALCWVQVPKESAIGLAETCLRWMETVCCILPLLR